MSYAEPESIEEAVALLAATDDGCCLAGGAALVALMNAGGIAPGTLVSLQRIAALSGIAPGDGGVWIGAMTNHSTVAADARLCGAQEVVRSAAGQIAHPAIRNMATLGGSICHADPASDLPGALIAAAARVEIAGPGGTRTMAAEDVFAGPFRTHLERGEIVTRVWLPRGPAGAVGLHLKHGRVDADYAIVSVSVVIAMDGDTCSHARVAVGSCGPVPVHAAAADQRLVGTALEPHAIAAAGRILVEAAAPVDDVRGSAAYRRLLIPRLLGRALAVVRERIHV